MPRDTRLVDGDRDAVLLQGEGVVEIRVGLHYTTKLPMYPHGLATALESSAVPFQLVVLPMSLLVTLGEHTSAR